MRRVHLIPLWVGVSAFLWLEPAAAQVERSGGGGANAALLQQYQQAVAERSQLQADNAKLKKSADDLKKQLDSANKLLAALKAGSTHGQAALTAALHENETAAKNQQDLKNKLQELVGNYRQTITTMRGVEAERTQLQQQVAQDKTTFDHCATANYELFKINGEILDRYEHQGAFSYMARAEPFTRLKRTQIQNLVDEYKERAEALRVQSRSADAAPLIAAPANAAPANGAAPPPSKQ
jgi:chromosome segregation ATPase